MSIWIDGLVHWLEQTSLHQTMQTVEWAVPAVQSVHILGIAAVFASSLVLSLRTLQLAGTDWTPARWAARLNGWIGWGLVVLALSGALMITGEPGRSLTNFLFQTKMLLLILAIALFLALTRALRGADQAGAKAPAGARLLAVALLLVWLVMIICGRWIAYS